MRARSLSHRTKITDFCPHLGSGITTDHNWLGWKFSVGQAARCFLEILLTDSRPAQPLPNKLSLALRDDGTTGALVDILDRQEV